ncbi:hypothetical protein BOX15_Mlig031807g2 [Macrostomum lignano]|uniref:Uncharacterized protein n=2 Tax=Macrostomum lignano TaxID=282301 RepID=A0A267EDN7_9PLAT|nr:hypothetical protein BOX15_Mlig031807g2 [Macrostomum lignano]
MSSSLPTALQPGAGVQRSQTPAAASSCASTSGDSSLASSSAQDELDTLDSEACLSEFYNCVNTSLMQYCLGCCNSHGFVIKSGKSLRWRRQIRNRIERRIYRLIGQRPDLSAEAVARAFGMACARSTAEIADRLGGRGWTSEKVSQALNQMISPILADLGLPAGSAQVSMQLPSFTAYSSQLSKKRWVSYAVRMPELFNLLRPFNELVTLQWTLDAQAIHQLSVIGQFVSFAASSARRAVAQFPVQLVDCLASMAVSGFALLAGTPARPDQVQLCTNRYMASTLWPRYRRLLLRLVAEHVANWASVQLNKRLESVDVDSMVAEAKTRLGWYSGVKSRTMSNRDEVLREQTPRSPTRSAQNQRWFSERQPLQRPNQRPNIHRPDRRPNQRPPRRSGRQSDSEDSISPLAAAADEPYQSRHHLGAKLARLS